MRVKLQRVQNVAAQIITRKSSSQNLKDLHWLPVKERIDYRIAILVYKCLNNMGPLYLAEMLKPYTPKSSYELRSLDENPLDIPDIRLEYGRRAFSYCGPKVWNFLPPHLTEDIPLGSFKRGLKRFCLRRLIIFDI